jgi:hypothetical protein
MVNAGGYGMARETAEGPLMQEPTMLFFSTSMPIPPFAGLSDAVVAQAPHSRFAFLMTPFRDVDDRPFLMARANRAEKDAQLAAMGAVPDARG